MAGKKVERVDVVDEGDNFLYSSTRQEVHKKGLLHRCVIGGVRCSDGRVMLVKQSSDRQDAGQHVSPVGGHVEAGEEIEEALRRETMEELGLRDFEYKLVGKAIFNREVLGRIENHYFIVYEIITDQIPNLGDEADEFVYYEEGELKKLLREDPSHFGDAYHFVVKEFYPDYLK